MVAFAYFLGARLGILLSSATGTYVSVLWPASGVALAAGLLLGPRIGLAVAAGSLAADLWVGTPPLIGLAVAAVNSLEAVIPPLIARRIRSLDLALGRLRDVWWLCSIIVLTSGIAGVFGAATLLLAFHQSSLVDLFIPWWFSAAAGSVLIAPAVLVTRSRPWRDWRRTRLFEGMVAVAAASLAGFLVFFEFEPVFPFALLLPFMVWGVARFGRLGAAMGTLVLSLAAIAHAPWGETDLHLGLQTYAIMLQFALGCMQITFLAFGAALDERRRSEMSRIEVERSFRKYFEQLPVGAYRANRAGEILAANSAVASLFRFSSIDELLAANLEEYFVESADRQVIFDRLRSGDGFEGLEFRMRRADGPVMWVRMSARAVRDENGFVRSVDGIVEDVTAEHQMKEALRENEASKEESLSRLRATLESTADGILVVDHEGNIVDYNLKFASMWGVPEPILESKDDAKALSYVVNQLEDPDRFIAKVTDLYSRPEAESFDVIGFKDGRSFERFSKPQRLGDRIVGRVWSFRDVTERVRADEDRRRLEQQLNQAQKMEAVGQLAGGIAHDFNNLLAVVINYAQLALDEVETGSQLKQDLGEVLRAGERGATLTRQLLTFSHSAVGETEIVNLNELVASTNKMLSRMISEAIQVHTELDPDLKYTRIDPGQFEQALMNLAINARDAMPTGGQLKIATRNLHLEGSAASEGDLPSGDYVVLDVTDTGAGISEDLMPRLFEPFFTTKAFGEGTGLGLAVVFGIVKNAGGDVFVTSNIGQGSRFRVYLPAVAATPEPHDGFDDLVSSDLSRGDGKTILIAEDEDQVRSVIERILSAAGYTVLAFGSPVDALRAHAEGGHEIDLLLTDVVMPELSGRELSERTGLPTVFMSGHADSVLPEVESLRAQGHFIDKPFARGKLLEAMNAAIEHHSTVGDFKILASRVER